MAGAPAVVGCEDLHALCCGIIARQVPAPMPGALTTLHNPSNAMPQLQATFDSAHVRIVDDSPVTVVLKDVGDALGYRAPDLSRSIKDKYKSTRKLHDASGRPNDMICVTYNGLVDALQRVRKPEAKAFLERLGSPVEWHTVTSIEASVTHRVKQVFAGHRIRAQKCLGAYRADLFLPDFDLVVEIDEDDHRNRNQLYEAQRDAFMQGSGYTVIRYDPDSEPIETLYASIHEHIFNYQ